MTFSTLLRLSGLWAAAVWLSLLIFSPWPAASRPLNFRLVKNCSDIASAAIGNRIILAGGVTEYYEHYDNVLVIENETVVANTTLPSGARWGIMIALMNGSKVPELV